MNCANVASLVESVCVADSVEVLALLLVVEAEEMDETDSSIVSERVAI